MDPEAMPTTDQNDEKATSTNFSRKTVHDLLMDAILIHTALGRIIQTLTEIVSREELDRS